MKHFVAGLLHAAVCFAVSRRSFALKRAHPESDKQATKSLEGDMPKDFATLAGSDVEYAKGLVDCEKGVLADVQGHCKEFRLLLDFFTPEGTMSNVRGALRPAIIIVHGGGNAQGDKSEFHEMASANFWAEHGYVAFVPNYRLKRDRGTYPGDDFLFQLSHWSSLYPAVRDVKACLRYIVARAHFFGVDPSRIIALGSSAGAMDILAAVYTSSAQFTEELSVEEDPTLSTVNIGVEATVNAVIMKWGTFWGVESYAKYSHMRAKTMLGAATSRPPVIQFHGTNDRDILFTNAQQTAGHLRANGVPNCLHSMPGEQHRAYNYGCSAEQITDNFNCEVIDQMALEFVQIVESNPTGYVKCPSVLAVQQ